MIDLNATQAAIRAGYSPKTANEQAARLLVNVSIQAELARLRAEQSRRTGVTADRVIRELAKIAFADLGDIVTQDGGLRADIAPNDRAAVASIKCKVTCGDVDTTEREVKTYDKLRALELLGKHLGMYQDKLQVSGQLNTGQLEAVLAQLRAPDGPAPACPPGGDAGG